jgi:hypothetical protein
MYQDDMNIGCPSAKTMYEKACLGVATTQWDNVKTLLRQQQQQQQKNSIKNIEFQPTKFGLFGVVMKVQIRIQRFRQNSGKILTPANSDTNKRRYTYHKVPEPKKIRSSRQNARTESNKHRNTLLMQSLS